MHSIRKKLSAVAVAVVALALIGASPVHAEETSPDTLAPSFYATADYNAPVTVITLVVTDDVQLASVDLRATGTAAINTTLSPDVTWGLNSASGTEFVVHITATSKTRLTFTAEDTSGNIRTYTLDLPNKIKQVIPGGGNNY